MLIMRLARIGRRNEVHFRLVLAEKKRAVQKKYIELLGEYHPMYKENQLKLNKERIEYWLSQGVQMSDTVNDMLFREKIGNLPKRKFSMKKKVDPQIAKAKAEAPKDAVKPEEAAVSEAPASSAPAEKAEEIKKEKKQEETPKAN